MGITKVVDDWCGRSIITYGARRLSEGTFPRAGSTSSGQVITRYTQMTPLRAEVVPDAA